jgi:chromosome partitioning protein
MDPASPKDWKLLEARPASSGEGRIVSVVNQKGGVAKTTTTVNLAAGLALRGHKVLVVDIDPQANATTGLGLERDRDGASTYDLLLEGLPPAEAIASSRIEGLDIIPSSPDLAGAEVELVGIEDREKRLRVALADTKGLYDVVFVDCPPSLGLLTVNALVGAHDLIVPVQCEYYALEGLGQLLGNAERVRKGLNPDLRIFGFLLTMYDARTRLSSQVEEEVRRHFGELVFETRIPRSVKISEAPSYGEPVLTLDPSSRGAVAYRLLASEVEARYGFKKKAPPPPPPPPQRAPVPPVKSAGPTPGPGGRGFGTVAPEPQGLANAWPPGEPWTVEAR